MSIRIVNRTPEIGETGVSPYQPVHFTLQHDPVFHPSSLDLGTLDIRFGVATWSYEGENPLDEAASDPYRVERLCYSGVAVGIDPNITTGEGGLVIEKTIDDPQDGWYIITSPRFNTTYPQLVVRATVRLQESGSGGDPKAGVFVINGPAGRMSGVEFLENGRICPYDDSENAREWDYSSSFEIIFDWDDNLSLLRILVGGEPFWELDYEDLTAATVENTCQIHFGVDGNTGSELTLTGLHFCPEVLRPIVQGSTNSNDFQVEWASDSAPWYQGGPLEDEVHVWNKIGSVTDLTKGVQISSSGSQSYLQRVDQRFEDDFTVTAWMRVVSRTPVGNYTGAAIEIFTPERQFRVAFLQRGVTPYIGVLTNEGSSWNLDDHSSVEFDWDELFRISIVYSSSLAKLFVLSSNPLDTPILEVDLTDIPVRAPDTTTEIRVGMVEPGYDGDVILEELIVTPYVDQCYFESAGFEPEGLDQFLVQGVEPVWSNGWLELGSSGSMTLEILPAGMDATVVAGAAFESGPVLPGSRLSFYTGSSVVTLRPYWSSHGKVMVLDSDNLTSLLSEVDHQTDYGNSRSFGVDWEEGHEYRIEILLGIRIRVFLDDLDFPVLSLDWPDDLPVSELGSQLAAESGALVTSSWKYLRSSNGTGWDMKIQRKYSGGADEDVLGRRALLHLFCEDLDWAGEDPHV